MSQYKEIVNDLKKLGVDFRINDLDEALEIKLNEEWQRINDTLEAVVRTNAREIGYGSKKKPSLSAMKDAYTKLAHQQRYNPIKDYFNSLEGYAPSSQGPYVIPALATYFKNPDGQFHEWLFKWMVGAIAKIYQGQRNAMLVLVAPQQIGKSFFCGWICPLADRFLKAQINPDSKDSHLRLADTMIWEVEELGATTRRADVEALKAFITKPFIYERPPYGRHPIHKPANASFVGTVNYDGAGFLNDPTGSTRFLSCEIEEIDFKYSEINPDKLWAEALWYYRNVPKSWELTQEQREKQTRINERFETTSALADVVETYLHITDDETDFMPTQEIRNVVCLHYRIINEQTFYNELGRVLNKLGLKSGRQSHAMGGKRGWFGLKKRQAEPIK
jgi:predicted P-loop ATPase